MAHDYKRSGTPMLFSALDVLETNVLARYRNPYSYNEGAEHLCRVDRGALSDKTLHLIEGNATAHKRFIDHNIYSKSLIWIKVARDILENVICVSSRSSLKKNAAPVLI